MNATRDAVWQGRLVLWQPARRAGYRFNLDPLLLSGFLPAANHVLDLGAGCGVLGLSMLLQGKAQWVTAVEVQEDLAALAERNGHENGVADRFTVMAGDLREVPLPAADLVVFNPPYFRLGEGRTSPNPSREAGRRELYGKLADFVSAAARSAGTDGSIGAIVRFERADELKELLSYYDWQPLHERRVRARGDTPARHVMVQAGACCAAGANAADDLIVHAGSGRAFTDEVASLVNGPALLHR